MWSSAPSFYFTHGKLILFVIFGVRPINLSIVRFLSFKWNRFKQFLHLISSLVYHNNFSDPERTERIDMKSVSLD